MKIRLQMVLWCSLLLGITPWVRVAGATGEFIETLATGHINWTQGTVVAQAVGTVEQAMDNLLQIALRVRVDAKSNVLDIAGLNPKVWTEVTEMAYASNVVARDKCLDGLTRVTVQMNMLGGFSQLLLPTEIKQVEPIKPLNGKLPIPETPTNPTDPASASPPYKAFTGLIVDARGIDVKPAMVPVLMDERGKDVYSPAFISREFAVQQGVCQYVRHSDRLANSTRVGPNPLWVKGLRAAGNETCDIVISNADASKIHGASAHLGFLKQCRVIIVVD